MKNGKRRVALWLTLLLVLTLTATAFGGMAAFAAETVPIGQVYSGRSEGLSETELYNATNIYDYNGNNPNITVNSDGCFKIIAGHEDAARKYKYYNVSSSGVNENSVTDNAPLITVLTHGLGGTASHWSNNIEGSKAYFAPDNDALFAMLAADSDANVYWAQMNEHKSFRLLDLKNPNNLTSKYYFSPQNGHTITQVDDISKHIIIVFEAYKNSTEKIYASDSYNNVVYEELNYMLSKIVYDVKALNNGKLPKINLIGHSRGGITNLQYALDHPQMVDSMFGIGTPYFGSNTASTEFGAEFANNSDGLHDIIDREIYTEYYARWKDTPNCKNIKAYALGGYSNTDFIFDSLLNSSDEDFESYPVSKKVLEVIKVLIRMPGIVNLAGFVSKIGDVFGVDVVEGYEDVLKDISFTDERIFVKKLWDKIFHKKPMYGTPLFMNDLLVDLSSQLGEDRHSDKSYGFIQNAREFKESDYDGIEKKMSMADMPAVVHNLEARDKQFINYIRKNINMGGVKSGYIYSLSGDNAVLNGYRGLMCKNGVLTVPSEIDGHIVTEISNNAFEDIGEREEFTKVIIPSTVTKLGEAAFAGNKTLTSVEFEEGSALKEIREECFAGCTALTALTIPAGTLSIAANAFYRCESLETLHLPASVKLLDSTATYGCSSLENITVDSENDNYTSLNGILFSKDGTILCIYPAGQRNSIYTVPQGVTSVWYYSFIGNKYLRTVNLNDVEGVYRYAFADCENLAEINGINLEWAEECAFENTAWLKNKLADDSVTYVELGGALVNYKGNDSVVTLENYSSISPYAFAFNKNLNKVILTGNTFSRIGIGAFTSCENLERVQIEKTMRNVYFYGDPFAECSENLGIYVPMGLIESYKRDEEVYADKFKSISTTVEFNADGGEPIDSTVFYYGEFLDELPAPEKEHYNFGGWQYFDGTETVSVALPYCWNYTAESAVLAAVWNEVEYNLYLHYSSKDIVETVYTWSQGLELPEATKVGYTFVGWYDNPEFEGTPTMRINAGESGLKELYAGFTPNTYTVTLNSNYPSGPQMQSVELTFAELYTLPVLEREGYIFNGWQGEDGEFYTSDKGIAFQDWNIPENTALKAVWTRKVFSVKVNGDGTIVWMTENNFSDEQAYIPFGTEFAAMDELIEAFKSNRSSLVTGYEFVGFYVNGEEFSIWDTMPDLGEDGSIFDIEAIYKTETYEIVFVDLDQTITVEYGAALTLPKANRYGYDFEFWKVCDNEYNRNTFAQNGKFAVGKIFGYSNMPDLSDGVGESGIRIYLEGDYTPKSNEIRFNFVVQEFKPQTIYHNTQVALPMPMNMSFKFMGWYESRIVNGQVLEEFITDSTGMLLQPWQYRENQKIIMVYTSFEIIYYTITYEANGGTIIGEMKTQYSNLFQVTLPKAEKEGYVFKGWYSQKFNGIIDKIPKGTTGDLHLEAQFEELYTVKYYNGASLLFTDTAIYGQKITLRKYDKVGYTAVWSNGLKAGVEYEVKGNVKLEIVDWDAHTFNISLYKYTPQGTVYYGSATVKYGSSYNLGVPSDMNFMGWYAFIGHFDSDAYPKQKKYTDANGNSINYWDVDEAVDLIAESLRDGYAITYFSRSDQYKITDSGRFKQGYDKIDLSDCGYSMSELYDAGYRSLTFGFYIDTKERYGGYRHIFLYDGESSSANCLGAVEFTSQTSSWEKYYVQFHITLTRDTPNTFYIRYGASGKFEDDWYCNNLAGNVSVKVNAHVSNPSCERQ